MQLKSLGVRIAIGDFGTGESSLSYLRKFRFDKIKIDRSFVEALDRGRDPKAMVKPVVGLAHSLGIQTCAEGVDRLDQLRLLENDGCGRPGPSVQPAAGAGGARRVRRACGAGAGGRNRGRQSGAARVNEAAPASAAGVVRSSK